MLVYLRHNLSFQLLGLLFQVRRTLCSTGGTPARKCPPESTAHNLFNYWQEIFTEELPLSLLEQVKKSPEEMEKIREELTNYELIADSAEQGIERPSDYETQKKYYSGKQKRHTFKSQFIVLPKGADIVDVVVGKPGPMSDIKICRQTNLKSI